MIKKIIGKYSGVMFFYLAILGMIAIANAHVDHLNGKTTQNYTVAYNNSLED